MKDLTKINPRTWEELKQIGSNLKNTEIIYHRFPHQNTFYRNEYMAHTPKQKVIEERIKKMKGGFCIVPNNFPYERLLVHIPNIKHFLLWSKSPLTKEDINTKLQNFFGEFDFFWYENDNKQKSIPEVFHVQVFVDFKNSDNALKFFDDLD